MIASTKAGQKQLQGALPELVPALKKILESSQGCLYVTDIDADKQSVIKSVQEVGAKIISALKSIVECGARVALQDSQLKLRNDTKVFTDAIKKVIAAVESLRNVDDLAAQQVCDDETFYY